MVASKSSWPSDDVTGYTAVLKTGCPLLHAKEASASSAERQLCRLLTIVVEHFGGGGSLRLQSL